MGSTPHAERRGDFYQFQLVALGSQAPVKKQDHHICLEMIKGGVPGEIALGFMRWVTAAATRLSLVLWHMVGGE